MEEDNRIDRRSDLGCLLIRRRSEGPAGSRAIVSHSDYFQSHALTSQCCRPLCYTVRWRADHDFWGLGMNGSDESNSLLREIRDLLAAQETKYQQHLVDIKAAYAEQLRMGEQARKKSLRTMFLGLLVLFAAMAAMLMWH